MLMIVEGVDTFGVGLVGPYLSKQFNISAEQLGIIYTGTVIASLIGAVVLAPLSDRFGKRTVLLWSCATMGPATLLTPFAANVYVLYLARFAIGLAFGATLPTVIALVADYAPKPRRAFLVMMINSGISLGVMVAGTSSAFIIPSLGWHWMLYFSAILSVAFTAILWVFLPESLQYLVREAPAASKTRAVVAKMLLDRKEHASPILVPDEKTKADLLPSKLVTEGRLILTALLWLVMSLAYVIINFDSYWLPTVLLQNGAGTAGTGFIISAGKMCGLACALIIGWVADRRGLATVLGFNYVGTGLVAVAVALLAGYPPVAVPILILALGLTNSMVAGTQALIVGAYPTNVRATATGWITGLARLVGGSAGTMVGGYLIDMHARGAHIAAMLGSILLVDGILVLVLRNRNDIRSIRVQTTRESPSTPVEAGIPR